MTITRIILLISIVFGGAAKAETVLVTSGEHDGFTRIVLKVSEALEWDLSVEGDVASILFERAVSFDDSGVFNRISKDRVLSTNVDAINGRPVFNISLSCDCKVTAERYLSEYIVVDISDPSGIQDAPVNIRHNSPQLGLPVDSDRILEMPDIISWASPQAPQYTETAHAVNFLQTGSIVAAGMTVFDSSDMLPFVAHADDGSGEGLVLKSETAEIEETVSAARTSLLEQLTLAAEQGFLEFTGLEVLDKEIPENDAPTEVGPAPVLKVEPPRDTRQWSLQTVFDRDATLANSTGGELNENCPKVENVNVASWSDGGNFNAEISEIRRNLIGEFDAPNHDAILDLIRLYLRYGFGAEARMYLQEFVGTVPGHAILNDLAVIVDGQQIAPDGPLFAAVECGGLVSVWALVGMYPSVSGDIWDIETVVDAFADMPIDLREMLGARLMMSFLDRGFVDISARISDILARAPGDRGSRYELSLATVLQENENTEEAREILSDLTDRHDDVSAEALAVLVRSLLESDQDVSSKMQLDIGSAANEARGTELGTEFQRLQALIVAREQGGNTALEMISSEIQKTPSNSDVLRRTASELLKSMSPEHDAPLAYLQAIVNYQGYVDEGVAGDALRLEIGEELLDYGFPSLALEFLIPLADSTNFQASIATAEAYLLMMDTGSVISTLSDLDGDRVRRLRAEAFLMSEDFEGALSEVLGITDPDMKVVEYGWYSGDWPVVAQENVAAAILLNQYIDSVVTVTAGDETTITPYWPSGPVALSDVQNLLTQSQDMTVTLQRAIQN